MSLGEDTKIKTKNTQVSLFVLVIKKRQNSIFDSGESVQDFMVFIWVSFYAYTFIFLPQLLLVYVILHSTVLVSHLNFFFVPNQGIK